MDCEVWEAPAGSGAETAARLRALVPGGGSVREPVAEILAAVRARGDEAVRAFTRRFDTRGADPRALKVDPEQLRAGR